MQQLKQLGPNGGGGMVQNIIPAGQPQTRMVQQMGPGQRIIQTPANLPLQQVQQQLVPGMGNQPQLAMQQQQQQQQQLQVQQQQQQQGMQQQPQQQQQQNVPAAVGQPPPPPYPEPPPPYPGSQAGGNPMQVSAGWVG